VFDQTAFFSGSLTVSLSEHFSRSSSPVASQWFTTSGTFLNSVTLSTHLSSDSAELSPSTFLPVAASPPVSEASTAPISSDVLTRSLSSDPNGFTVSELQFGYIGLIAGVVVLVIVVLVFVVRCREHKSGESRGDLEMTAKPESILFEFETRDSAFECLNPETMELGGFADVFTIGTIDEMNGVSLFPKASARL
jgi:hypothetical protein